MSGFAVKRDSGLFIGDVDVAPASGTIDITENGTDIDVARYAKANVNVSGLTVNTITYDNVVEKCEPVSGSLYDLQIPSDVEYTRLSNECCFANNNVKTVTIGDNITTIANGLSQNQYGENNAVKISAFGYCKNLTDVLGGTNIIDVGDLTFVGCDELSNVSALFNSGSLKHVGDYAFYGCRSLTGTIKFNALNEIGASAFRRTQLNNIYIIGTDTNIYNAWIRSRAFKIESGHYDKLILNTSGPSTTLDIEGLAFSGSSGTYVSVLAILSNHISFSTDSFSDFHSNIIDFYTHLNQSDFTTWLNNLNDTTLKNAITNASNIHYEYSGDGSEL